MKMRRLPTWREMHMDTSPEVEAIQFKFYREAPAWRKIEMMSSLSNTVRQLTIQGLRRRHPNATDQELKLLLVEAFHGSKMANQVRKALVQQMGSLNGTSTIS